MKTLILKYNQLNIKKPVSIYDAPGTLKFEVTQEFPKNKITTLTTTFRISNAEGTILLTLSSEGISQVPLLKYSIVENETKIGEVIGKRTFASYSEFNMKFNNEQYKLSGLKKFLFSEIEFEITKDNCNIAKITKKWYKSTYQIDVNEEKESVPIICLVTLLSHLLNIRQR